MPASTHPSHDKNGMADIALAAFDCMSEAVIVCDAQDRIQAWNHAAEDVYGFTEIEAVGQVSVELLHTKANIGDPAVSQRAKDGRELWVESREIRLPGEDGRVLYLNRDVSASKQLQKRSELVLESVTNAFIEVNFEGICLAANNVAFEMLGHRPDELIGHSVWELHPHLVGSEFEQRAIEAVQTGKTTFVAEHLCPLGVWYESYLHPTPTGLAIFLTDITRTRETNEALRHSKERLRLAIEASEIGTWYWDLGCDDLHWSDRVRQLWGLAPGEPATYERFLQGLHPDDRPQIESANMERRKEVAAFSREYRLLNRDGSITWIRESGRAYYGEDERVCRVIGTIQDCTAQKDSDFEIAQHARQHAAVADLGQRALVQPTSKNLLSDAVNIAARTLSAKFCRILRHDSGGDLMVVAAAGFSDNDVAEQMRVPGGNRSHAGYVFETQEAVISLDLRDEKRFNVPQMLLDQGVICGVGCPILLNRNAWGVLIVHDSQCRSFSKDDLYFLKDIASIVGHALERDAFEKERSLLLADLRASNLQLNAVIDSMSEGLMIASADGDLLRINPAGCAIFRAKNELEYFQMREKFELYWCSADAEGCEIPRDLLPLNRACRGEKFTDYVMRTQFVQTGEWCAVSISGAPVLGPDGEPWCSIVTFRDITAEVEADEALLQFNQALEERVAERTAELAAANREMEGFTYTVAHDLRAPLRAIVSSSRILLEDFADELDPQGKNQLERQAAAARKLGLLIDDLLMLSRLGRASINRVEFNVSKLAEEVATEVRDRDWDRPVSIVIEPNISICGDPRLIRFLLQNLFENACKFSYPELGANIEMVAVTGGFLVRDNGIGFDQLYVGKIFEPFERLVKESEYPGTGIGLANVKRIVDRHGGQIAAEGREGRGATFTCVF